ncbi:MAG: hypothetical protein Kow00121_44540 [Elainellaceae cyanobacterium]
MINQPHLPELLEWQSLPIGMIELTPEQINQAVQISQSLPNREAQWQVYANALSLLGFQSWLEAWGADLAIDTTTCTLHQSQYASLIDAVTNLQVGAFKLCLVTVNSVAEPLITVPKAVIDVDSFQPYFYVLVEVIEEELMTRIYGYLRSDQLVEHQSSLPAADTTWSYALPRDWFHPDPNALLLELRCLEPGAIVLPHTSSSPLASAVVERRLDELTSQLQTPTIPLSQLLNWEEIATILHHPFLADRLHQIQQPPAQSASVVSDSLQVLTQQAINAGVWLRDQLDAAAQELSWVLLPTLTPAMGGLRSAAAELSTIARSLEQVGLVIPAHARIAYRDLLGDRTDLRLYAATWELPDSSQPEWALLLVLGSQSANSLPIGTWWQVSDLSQPLVEQVVTEMQLEPYLYTQVEGSWEEQFQVTIAQPSQNETHTTTFTFAFHPDL